MSAEQAVKYTWRYPLWHSHEGYSLKTGQIVVDDEVVQTYPDNDGGVWYYDKDGRKVNVK